MFGAVPGTDGAGPSVEGSGENTFRIEWEKPMRHRQKSLVSGDSRGGVIDLSGSAFLDLLTPTQAWTLMTPDVEACDELG